MIGGFALVGSRFGQPDIDDDYGDTKNITFAVNCMEAMRVEAFPGGAHRRHRT